MNNPTKVTATPGLFASGVNREVVARTALRAYPGWTILTYRDEHGRATYCAQDNTVAIGPLDATFADAVHFARHGSPVSR